LLYSFYFIYSSGCTKLFGSKNNEHMIAKKKKEKEKPER